MFHYLSHGRSFWDIQQVELFLRWNSIYATEQSINAIFWRLDHDDDNSLSYSEYREALNSHLSYPYTYSPIVRETVIVSPARVDMRSSVYSSPYWASLAQEYRPAHRSPYAYWTAYYPEPYVSPSRYRSSAYETPIMQYQSPSRSNYKNYDMPYAPRPDNHPN